MNSINLRYCRGSIAVITAVSIVVLIAMVGLTVDLGRGYGVKAKLNAAVDAAALAAGRAMAVGETEAERIANAQAAAQRFFAGNFPTEYLGATPTGPVTTVTHDQSGFWTVTVSASANMPTTFLRVIGKENVPTTAMGVTIRRDVDVMLVLDTSGSLGPPTSPSNTLPRLKECAKSAFVSRFIDGPGGDRLGLVSFASGAVVDVPINKNSNRGFDRDEIEDHIDALTVRGSTASAEGMRRALNELIAIPSSLRSSLRAIVFFSDGAPNDVPATFEWRRNAQRRTQTGDLYSETESGGRPRRIYDHTERDDQLNPPPGNNWEIRYLPEGGFNITGVGTIPLRNQTLAGQRSISGSPYDNTRCNVNKAARNMVEHVANTARSQEIYVHTTALGTRVQSNEIDFCGYGVSEYGENIMKRLANTTDSDTYNSAQVSGIYHHFATIEGCEEAFSRIASEILRLAM